MQSQLLSSAVKIVGNQKKKIVFEPFNVELILKYLGKSQES